MSLGLDVDLLTYCLPHLLFSSALMVGEEPSEGHFLGQTSADLFHRERLERLERERHARDHDRHNTVTSGRGTDNSRVPPRGAEARGELSSSRDPRESSRELSRDPRDLSSRDPREQPRDLREQLREQRDRQNREEREHGRRDRPYREGKSRRERVGTVNWDDRRPWGIFRGGVETQLRVKL